MKRIVFVIEQLAGGGAERVTAALANQLCRNNNFEIHMVVYTSRKEENYPTDERILWHVLPRITAGRVGAILNRFRYLRDTICSIRADCVICLGTPRIAVLLTLSMIGCGIPLILSERNDPTRYPVTRIWRSLRTFSYYLSDAVVFQTSEAKDYFPSFVQKKGVVISNPITGNLPESWEGNRRKRIVNFCRLSPQKNLDLLIDAFSDISSTFPDYELWIYGEGDERQHLEKKISELALESRVRLPGHRQNIYEEIRDAALFVSSSDYEGISNSMLEAITIGVPTICTDCPAGGAREMIQNRENGILVPVGDRKSLAAAMREVLMDPVLADKMSQNGTLLRDKIGVPFIAAKWMDLINQFIV